MSITLRIQRQKNTYVTVKEAVQETYLSQKPIDHDPGKQVFFEATTKQQEYINACLSGKYRYLLYGGAIRGGKTYVGLSVLLLLSRVFPGSRWFVVRADMPSIKRNVLPTFHKLCPPSFLKDFNQSSMTATFTNDSQIIFFSEQIHDDPELMRWRGLEFNGIMLEEANELAESTWHKAVERLGSWLINPMPPMLILATCNPAQGWLKALFYDKWVAGTLKEPYYFLQAKITDNPHIPQEFIDKLADMPKALYSKFVDGSWDADDDIDQLISWEDIHKAEALIPCSETSGFALGVDVGRFGKDPSIWYIMKGPNLYDIIRKDKTSIDEVYDHTKRVMIQYGIKADNVGIDVVGLGGGVVDFLHKDGLYVHGLGGGDAPIALSMDSNLRMFTFANLRAQMYWQLKKDFSEGLVGGLVNAKSHGPMMRDDLACIRYSIKGDKKIYIESKEDIKKRLHRSPDYSDAMMYANWVRKKNNVILKPGVYFG